MVGVVVVVVEGIIEEVVEEDDDDDDLFKGSVVGPRRFRDFTVATVLVLVVSVETSSVGSKSLETGGKFVVSWVVGSIEEEESLLLLLFEDLGLLPVKDEGVLLDEFMDTIEYVRTERYERCYY